MKCIDLRGTYSGSRPFKNIGKLLIEDRKPSVSLFKPPSSVELSQYSLEMGREYPVELERYGYCQCRPNERRGRREHVPGRLNAGDRYRSILNSYF